MNIILNTERLVLRTWLPADLPLMVAINSDPAVMEYFPGLQDHAMTKRFIEHINAHYYQFAYALYAVEVKENHEFIGFVGLNHPNFEIPHFKPKSLPIVEIGWRLAALHWNKGYATEAARAVLDYAFNKLHLNEIISFTVDNNARSRRVMEKIGLKRSPQDDFEHPKLPTNSPLKNHVLYRLTKEEYHSILSK